MNQVEFLELGNACLVNQVEFLELGNACVISVTFCNTLARNP